MSVEVDSVVRFFNQKFGGGSDDVQVYRASGRVNLIGEHTDYNLGFVLPIALDLACFVAARAGSEGKLRVYSANLEESREWNLEEISGLKPQEDWGDYVVGVAQQLQRHGVELRPLDMAIYSTVPVGSGLSSSAAIEVASALALLQNRPIEKLELARLAQRAEREFVGVPCGIMDQYVSVFGEENHAIKIDCRSLTHEAGPLPAEVAVIAVNSMVKHELGSSAYATRVQECAEAVAAIQQIMPEVQSLRDVPSGALEAARERMSEVVYRRARHITTETERVPAFLERASKNDLHGMGRLFIASHRSLQRDYEVSCEELDFLVDTASGFSGVYGARMTGGGFGGCTVNLVAPERVDQFEGHIQAAYKRRYDLDPTFYRCKPARGAGRLR